MQHHKSMCVGIMATDPHGVVGTGQGLPWSIPQEVAHFRKITHKQPLIMGRKTFDELSNEQLCGRLVGVFSRKPVVRKGLDVITLPTLSKWKSIQPTWPNAYMIGGAALANIFLQNNALDGFILTRIHASYMGNCRLSMELFQGWQIIKQEVYNDYTIQYMIPSYAKGTFDDIFIPTSRNS